MTNLHNLLQKVWYDLKPDLLSSTLRIVLSPFSEVYSLFARRNRLKTIGEKFTVPVISVGNLTVGGTGKTIFVVELNKLLIETGLHGVILTRGHGRKSKKAVFLYKENRQLPSPCEAGDEPLVLYQQCAGTPIVIGSDRCKNYKEYVAVSTTPDFILLDDGFQHHAIEKDINICLIDGKRLFGNGHCLPAGPLREALAETPKPDVFILTRYDAKVDLKGLRNRFPEVPLIKTTFKVESFTSFVQGGEKVVPPKRVLLVSALGNNDQFRKSVEDVGFHIVEHCLFPDHHFFSQEDVLSFEDLARQKGIGMILTTWKDAVKIRKWIKLEKESNIKWCACNLSVIYEDDGYEVLKKIIMKAFL